MQQISFEQFKLALSLLPATHIEFSNYTSEMLTATYKNLIMSQYVYYKDIKCITPDYCFYVSPEIIEDLDLSEHIEVDLCYKYTTFYLNLCVIIPYLIQNKFCKNLLIRRTKKSEIKINSLKDLILLLAFTKPRTPSMKHIKETEDEIIINCKGFEDGYTPIKKVQELVNSNKMRLEDTIYKSAITQYLIFDLLDLIKKPAAEYEICITKDILNNLFTHKEIPILDIIYPDSNKAFLNYIKLENFFLA